MPGSINGFTWRYNFFLLKQLKPGSTMVLMTMHCILSTQNIAGQDIQFCRRMEKTSESGPLPRKERRGERASCCFSPPSRAATFTPMLLQRLHSTSEDQKRTHLCLGWSDLREVQASLEVWRTFTVICFLSQGTTWTGFEFRQLCAPIATSQGPFLFC